MHAQRVTEVRALHGDGVVEVLCVLAVDGEDRGITQVKALVVFFLGMGASANLSASAMTSSGEVDVYATHRQHSVRTDAGTGADTQS